jgi:hypothetical protein
MLIECQTRGTLSLWWYDLSCLESMSFMAADSGKRWLGEAISPGARARNRNVRVEIASQPRRTCPAPLQALSLLPAHPWCVWTWS